MAGGHETKQQHEFTDAHSVGKSRRILCAVFLLGANMETVEREPVIIWATVGALVSALLIRFVPDLGNEVIDAVVNAIVVLGPVIAGAAYARHKVTPVAAPKTDDGKPAALVPVEYWQKLVTRSQQMESGK